MRMSASDGETPLPLRTSRQAESTHSTATAVMVATGYYSHILSWLHTWYSAVANGYWLPHTIMATAAIDTWADDSFVGYYSYYDETVTSCPRPSWRLFQIQDFVLATTATCPRTYYYHHSHHPHISHQSYWYAACCHTILTSELVVSCHHAAILVDDCYCWHVIATTKELSCSCSCYLLPYSSVLLQPCHTAAVPIIAIDDD